jgi:hypothetical protein
MVVVPNTCLMESNPIVILSDSALRENFRCWMEAQGMPIQF